MIVAKKGTGAKGDEIRADLPEEVAWVKIRDVDENNIEVRIIDQKSQSEQLKQEILDEQNQRIDTIADLIENAQDITTSQGKKDLADAIRNTNLTQ